LEGESIIVYLQEAGFQEQVVVEEDTIDEGGGHDFNDIHPNTKSFGDGRYYLKGQRGDTKSRV
jgi:hypothetical protein